MNNLHHIRLDNGQIIAVTIVRKRIRNLILRLHAPDDIRISAPLHVPLPQIDTFILSKQVWLQKALSKLTRPNAVNHCYLPQRIANGEQLRLLGQNYTIRIERSLLSELFLHNGILYIYIPHTDDPQALTALFNNWLSGFIQATLSEIFTIMQTRFAPLKLAKARLRIKLLKATWGSCRMPGPLITLNAALIHSPVACIEYVIAHELAHIRHFNHGQAFYALLAAMCPDWQTQKKLLKTEYSSAIRKS